MKRYLLYNILFCAVLLCSCVDEYNAELPDSTQQMLVVEGDIYSDSTTTIRLTHTIGLTSGEVSGIPTVSSAKVSVKGTDGSLYNAVEGGSGAYKLTVGHLSPNEQYWLSITTFDGLNYESEPASPIDAPSFILSYEQKPEEELPHAPVNVYVTAEKTDEPLYLCWSYNECSELKTPCSTIWNYYPAAMAIDTLSFPIDHGFGMRVSGGYIAACSDDYQDNRIDGYRLVSIPITSPRLCYVYYICARQEAITKAEYEYEEARRKQSDEMGGLFTPQPSQLPTNIHCTNGDKGVIGYIGVRGRVTQCEMYLRNAFEIRYKEARKYRIIMPDEIAKNSFTPQFLYSSGYQVMEYDPTQGKATWITRWAIDCRERTWGFTTFEQPDYWNPHYENVTPYKKNQ